MKPPEFEIGDEVTGHMFGAVVTTHILDKRALGRNRFEYRFYVPVDYILKHQADRTWGPLHEREIDYLKRKQHDWWMQGGGFQKVEPQGVQP